MIKPDVWTTHQDNHTGDKKQDKKQDTKQNTVKNIKCKYVYFGLVQIVAFTIAFEFGV